LPRQGEVRSSLSRAGGGFDSPMQRRPIRPDVIAVEKRPH
jgi:hypothetical protein